MVGDWLSFQSRCKECRACSLASTRTQVVIGRGGKQAPLFLLGEAPGAEEDRLGLPFVGRSGKLLTRLLLEAGFEEGSYYIGNVVKCRPPKNRVPTREERLACRGWLEEQFALVGAKVVMPLGNTAFQAFTGSKTSITQVRGQWLQSDKLPWVLPSVHPAYALRCPSAVPLLLADLLEARRVLIEQGWMKGEEEGSFPSSEGGL